MNKEFHNLYSIFEFIFLICVCVLKTFLKMYHTSVQLAAVQLQQYRHCCYTRSYSDWEAYYIEAVSHQKQQ